MKALRRTAAIVMVFVSGMTLHSLWATEQPKPVRYGNQPGQPEGVVVTGAHSHDSSFLQSNRIIDGGNAIEPHGLSVWYKSGSLTRTMNWDAGRIVAVTDYWPASGYDMRTVRVNPHGDGTVVIRHFDPQVQPLAQGNLKFGKPWSGQFLEVGLKANSFGVSEMKWVNYADGKLQGSKPATFEDLGVPAEHLAAHRKDADHVAAPWKLFFNLFDSQLWDQPIRDIAAKAMK